MWYFLFALAAMAGLAVPLARLITRFRRPGARPRKRTAFAPPSPLPPTPTPADRTADLPAHGAAPDVPFTPPPLPRAVAPVPSPVPAGLRHATPSEPTFELIPRRMARINARAVLPGKLWSRLSTMVIEANGGQCCECANELRTRMECHEVWKYEWVPRPGRTRAVGVMRLVGLQPLCHLCHMGKHIKFAESQGELPRVMAHLMKLHAGLTEERIGQLMREAVAANALKYRYEQLDLRYLNDPRFAPIRARFGRDFTDNELRKPVPA